MPKLNNILLIVTLLLLLQPDMMAQIIVSDAQGEPMIEIQNGRIRTADSDRTLLNVKGNLIFNGSSSDKDDIAMLVKAEDIFARKPGQVLLADMEKVRLSIRKGGIYIGENSAFYDFRRLAYFVKEKDQPIQLFDAQQDRLLATFSAEATGAEMIAVFTLLSDDLGLEVALLEKLVDEETGETPINELSGTEGTIKRIWQTNNDEFSWDGFTLKRRWNSFDYEEWNFDGKVLKRAWYPDPTAEWTWDGKVLKKKWGTGNDEFEWDGYILRRRWNTGKDEFSVQGTIVKRVWDDSGNDEWQVDGDVPIPIIAMVVFGLMR